MNARDTRSERGREPHRLPSESARFAGPDSTATSRQADIPHQSQAHPERADGRGLLRHARLMAFGGLSWILGALVATVSGMWGTSSVPLLAAALLLALPLAVIGAAVVLRNTRGPGEQPLEADVPATHDATTGLPGQAYFQERLKEEVERARRYGRSLAVVIVDVNELHTVNEQYDWACGDQVLDHLAHVIDGTRRASDVLARLNADRFGVILSECNDEGAAAFVGRVEDRLTREPARAHFRGQVVMLWVGVCAGIASLSPQVSEPSKIVSLAEADLAAARERRTSRRQRWLSA